MPERSREQGASLGAARATVGDEAEAAARPGPSDRPGAVAARRRRELLQAQLRWQRPVLVDEVRGRLVLAQDVMPPDTHNTDLHFHSARGAWYVRGGSGVARLGRDGHALRAGSFRLNHENTGVGHGIEVGPDGRTLVTMGDLIPGEVVVYPEKRTLKPARGLELPYPEPG